MDTTIVLLNRDLRVHDHPALAAACARSRRVVPLFVVDPALTPYRRAGFLADALRDLRSSLRRRGGDLVVRRGDPVAETMRLAEAVGAQAVWVSADVTSYAQRRERLLADECARRRIDFRTFAGVTVVPPDALRPSGGDHYRVFTPYWRAWSVEPRRPAAAPPDVVRLPDGLEPGTLPVAAAPYGPLVGGETEGRRRMRLWLRHCLEGYAEAREDLAGETTSRLSPYLHLGCLSPLELASLGAASEEFVQQLCWRDFHHQVTRAFPAIGHRDYRARGDLWNDDENAVSAWREGRTGVPIVDAAMRQLAQEGWLHNRARLIVASYLTKCLHVDWRIGARHFAEQLLDADVAVNCGNWQWVAGTGNDTRPSRSFNPLRQAKRFDPDGEYVRRYVPELAHLPRTLIHEPWKTRTLRAYPAPLPLPETPPRVGASPRRDS
ncbi:deoxyribodipyrimidine photo-lyase [Thermopolyspora sp. NPDC052614]|uniref:cryptochrome/photolyase family protein n=1 Tax=Thermopolyspora sp. NPDC052614 TaxID=3155682 RepID=UPI0034192A76